MSTKVLVVDDKQMMRDSVASPLQRADYTVVAASDGASALNLVAKHRPAVVVTDLKMPEMDGLELLTRLRQTDDQLPVVLMTAYGSVGDAVRAMKEGAFDFIPKPFEGDQLVMVVRRAVQHHRLLRENAALRSTTAPFDQIPALVGKTPGMKGLAQQIHQVANSRGTVLICGESGTGKEVVARTIHAYSPRRERVMLCLNCAALSSSLLESELFGHEKGAFTGADQLRKGRFELTDRGTLLLDEISEIGPELQAKLLRVLQEGEFERVGSSLTMQVDVRVIATTNRDLTRSVASGGFRQDLYYRLNVLPLHVPPLRDRAEDIPLLAEHFLMHVAFREGRAPKRFDEAAIELMKQYPWPGNVRELQNICERASVLSRGPLIKRALITPWLSTPGVLSGPTGTVGEGPWPIYDGTAPIHAPAAQMGENGLANTPGSGHGLPLGSGNGSDQSPGSTRVSRIRPLEEVEREQVVQALGHFGGNRQRSAAALGIGVRTLGLKLKKWKEANLVAQTI